MELCLQAPPSDSPVAVTATDGRWPEGRWRQLTLKKKGRCGESVSSSLRFPIQDCCASAHAARGVAGASQLHPSLGIALGRRELPHLKVIPPLP